MTLGLLTELVNFEGGKFDFGFWVIVGIGIGVIAIVFHKASKANLSERSAYGAGFADGVKSTESENDDEDGQKAKKKKK